MFGTGMLRGLDMIATRRVRFSAYVIALIFAIVASMGVAVAGGTYAELLNTDQQAIGFTGYVKDTESGLYYANARYYDPRVARFITNDPEEGNPMQPPSLHRYLYAYANPTVYVDPTGRDHINYEQLLRLRLMSEQDPNRAAALREQVRIEDTRIGARATATFEDFRDTAVSLYRFGKNILKASYESSLLGYATGAGSEGVDALASSGTQLVNKVAHPIDDIYTPISNQYAEAAALDEQGQTYSAEYTRQQATLETGNVVLTATGVAGLAKSGTRSLAKAFFLQARGSEALVVTESASRLNPELVPSSRLGGATPAEIFLDPTVVEELDEAYRPAGRADKPAQVRVNQHEGARRESETLAELQARYPGANIQQQVYLRTGNGRRAIDEGFTDEGRRLDFVVVQDGRVVDVLETTSPTARKGGQFEKEQRIRANGGTFVRDRQADCLLDVCNVSTQEDRRQ